MFQAVAKRVMLDTGIEVSYVEQGDQQGMPLVLLHGYSDSWRSWQPFLGHVPHQVRAFAMTQRGHGDSAKPASYRIAEFAADLESFMGRLGIERAVIVGHSMGSLVASRFAIDHPERLLGLVLVGAFTTVVGNSAVGEMWPAVAAMSDPIDARFVREFQESTLARPIPPDFLETVIAESLKMPARVWRAVLRALMDEDFSVELGRIASPTCIIWGDKDAITGRDEQEALAASIRGARLIVHANGGHSPHWENPGRAAAEIVAFMHEEARALVLPAA